MNDEIKEFLGWAISWIAIILLAILIIIVIFFGSSFIGHLYDVWASAQEGKAELAKADWNRQIAVREAKAKEESSTLLAEAEIIRAKGVAKANKIIGESLNNNESYLRYLWIQNIENSKNQVIYVPTETNLSILEANRLKGNSNAIEKR